MHACGMYNGTMFTNSLEAFEYWWKKGIKLFEIDIDRTDDGEYVACHDFCYSTFKKMEIDDIPSICSREWFLNQKIFSKTTEGLTTMDLERIFELLRLHKDMSVMIDPKVYSYSLCCELLGKIRVLIEEYNINKNQVIFETYNMDMIQATKKFHEMLQYQHCIDDEIQMGTSAQIRELPVQEQINILKQNEIKIISYPWKFMVERLDILKTLREEEFVIFSKTRNNIFSELLIQAEVSVNLIDHLVTDIQRIELSDYKKEYFKKYAEEINVYFKR